MIAATDFHIVPSGDHLKKMTEDCDEQDGQGDDDEDDNDDGTDVNGDDDGTDVNGDEDDDDSTGVDEIKSDSSDGSVQACKRHQRTFPSLLQRGGRVLMHNCTRATIITAVPPLSS